MTDIYDQHRAAFSNVSAYVVTDKAGSRIATIAFKFPKDGAGRLYCYFHFLGLPMVRGFAGGYGYDKRSAALQSAICKAHDESPIEPKLAPFTKLVKAMDGGDWENVLFKAGFNVLQSV